MAEKKQKEEKAGGLGFAAALVAAAAAGMYLYGKNGTERRQKIQAWSLKAKADVLEQFEKRKEVGKAQYEEVIDKVTAKYARLKNVGDEEATKLNKELKKHWKAISDAAQVEPKKGRKSTK